MIQKLIKELFHATIISFVVFMILVGIRFMAGSSIAFDYKMLTNFGYTMLYGLVLYMINAAVFIWLDKIFEKNRFTPKRIALGFFISFIITIFTIFLLRIFEDVIIEGRTFEEFFTQETFANYIVATLITFVVTLAIHAFYFYKAYNENRVKEQKMIAGTASAQFESLKNQIDPHFLFNSLNVLSSLIEENPDNAQKFTASLSKIYRYVLEHKDKELVSLEEELSFAKTYMKLLKMRFENSVFYELPDTIANPEAKVVPLSLQLLLENTVKHNVASEAKPLHIRIYEQDQYLMVENDYQKKEVLQDRRGVGLQNIINRYAIITNRKVLIEQDKAIFRVALPMLTKQILFMETNNTSEQNIYLKAQKRVEDIKGFYSHLTVYVIVILGLAILNLVTYPKYLWFLFPALGWGIGVLIHAMTVFNYLPFLGSKWEERKIQELLNKDKFEKWN
ncbi:histidine kinase [Flavobacterium sp. NST-5]|uniref:Histidine kinase n=1 Tax=Flavobacterium ichthyis TaxID=2698827 RepID=A0ABW9Z8T4_9FLAO|nr:2TM domain-containing protein [Flavobacterium ichthyis]NBL65282.1 histidine kinase [Flavobacterium ichthyis]